jgi:hypothetical protein
VAPGQVRTLEVEIVGLDNGDAYAVELKRLRFPGVVSGNELAYTDDCTWAYWGEPGKYYTDPAVGYSWGSGPTTFAFDVQVSQDAPEDHYDLVVAVAGKLADGNGLFTAEEHFYLQVTTSNLRGDFDGDGDVDIDDYDLFITCFAGPGGRIETGCELCDLDGDGDVDCSDWELFGQLWTEFEDSPEFAACAAGVPVVPAVSGWSLAVMAMGLAAAGTVVRRRRRIGA